MPDSKRKRIALYAIIILIVGAILAIENPFASLGAASGSSASASKRDGALLVPGSVTSSQSPSGQQGIPDKIDPAAIQAQGVLAKEVAAPDLVGIEGWINSQPISIRDLRGKVVLIDFWTYTCVNCIRTLPYVKEWQSKYGDKGLQIIGVHTPEFGFEKDQDNVERAVKEFGITYPVVMDNDYKTWKAYSNRFWPHKYLIDKDGLVRYHVIGEGRYKETEEWVQRLLVEAGTSVRDVATVDDAPRISDVARRSITPELYAGFAFQTALGNPEGHEAFSVVEYTDPGMRENGKLYAQGPWFNSADSLQHARVTQDLEDYIVISFNAGNVNAVIELENDQSFEVYVSVDGKPVEKAKAGEDLRYDSKGNSYILVDVPKMFSLFRSNEFESHELKLSSNSDGFGLYTFTFGS